MKTIFNGAATALLSVMLLAGISTVQAQSPEPVQTKYMKKVSKALEKAGYAFEVDEDGDLKIEVVIGQGRTQLAWIMLGESVFGTIAVRDVYSIAWMTQPDSLGIKEPNAEALLLMNETTKIGAWSILEKDGIRAYLYTIKALADIDLDILLEYVEAVAIVGDYMEKEFEGTGLLPNVDVY